MVQLPMKKLPAEPANPMRVLRLASCPLPVSNEILLSICQIALRLPYSDSSPRMPKTERLLVSRPVPPSLVPSEAVDASEYSIDVFSRP
ncbi:hypothetical protein D3C87_1782860 [compost metagenome]